MVWLQSGHFKIPSATAVRCTYDASLPSGVCGDRQNLPFNQQMYPSISSRRDDQKPLPIIQSENNFERFDLVSLTDATVVRWTAYMNYQGGAAGFNYGALGLYCGLVNLTLTNDPCYKSSLNWALPTSIITAEQAIGLPGHDARAPGGDDMKYTRAFDNMFQWWKLEPWYGAISDHVDFPVKGSDTEIAVYFPPQNIPLTQQVIVTLPSGHSVSTAKGTWFDPRTGLTSTAKVKVISSRSIRLQAPIYNSSGHDDWLMYISYTP